MRYARSDVHVGFLIWIVIGLASFATLLHTIWFVIHFTSSAPFWDFWNWLSDYKSFVEGKFSFSDLTKLHNEHRLLTTRLILLLDASVFRMTGQFVTVFNLCLLAGTGFLIARLSDLTPISRQQAVSKSLVFMAIMGSIAQWQNLILPFQIQYAFLCLFTVSAATSLSFVTGDDARSVKRFLFSGQAGIYYALGLYSMAGGFLALPWLLLQMVLQRTPKRDAALFFTIVSFSTALFFKDYHPDRAYPITSPANLTLIIGLLKFAASFLGCPFYPFGVVPMYAGLLGMVLFACCFVGVLHAAIVGNQPVARQTLALLTVSGTVTLAACAASVSRYSAGAAEAVVPRYGTLALLFWLSLLPLLWHQTRALVAGGDGIFLAKVPAVHLLTLLPLALFNLPSRYLTDARNFAGVLESQAQSMRQNVYVAQIFSQTFYGSRDDARSRIAFLHAHALGPFAMDPPSNRGSGALSPDGHQQSKADACRGEIDLSYRLDESRFVLRMWLEAAHSAVTADEIVLLDGTGRIKATLAATEYRRKIGVGSAKNSGGYGVYSGVFIDNEPADRDLKLTAIGTFRGAPKQDCSFASPVSFAPIQVRDRLDYDNVRLLSASVSNNDGAFRRNGLPFEVSLATPWPNEEIYGSGQGGDRVTGTMTISLPTPAGLLLPIATGPDPTGQIVTFAFQDGAREEFAVPSDTTQAKWRILDLSPTWMRRHGGGTLRVELQDAGSGWGQWMAVGIPVARESDPRSATLY